jgi:adenylate cyclase
MNAQLIDAESGAHVWADRFDTDRTNLVEAQSEITGRLARTLNIQLVEAANRRIEQERQVNPDARDLVMRGWAQFNRPRSVANSQEARRTFEQALEIDPHSVDARIGLATVLAITVSNGWSSSIEEDQARAELLLVEAVGRDPNRSTAHYAMGVLRRVQNRLVESQIEMEAAVALDRNNAWAVLNLGEDLMRLGQPQAGIPHIEKAIRLNPHDPNMGIFYWALGTCNLLLGHADQAIDLLRKARAANPRLWYIDLHLAGALGVNGDLEEARAALAEAINLKSDTNSLARLRAQFPVANPAYWALYEETVVKGLRRAGFPDE